jgi:hypothetical protein
MIFGPHVNDAVVLSWVPLDEASQSGAVEKRRGAKVVTYANGSSTPESGVLGFPTDDQAPNICGVRSDVIADFPKCQAHRNFLSAEAAVKARKGGLRVTGAVQSALLIQKRPVRLSLGEACLPPPWPIDRFVAVPADLNRLAA